MTTPNDELGKLWQSVPVGGITDPGALLSQLQIRAQLFDRTIRNRDWREYIGGAAVAVVFLWMSLRAKSPLDFAADVWLAACGVWVILYLRRYSRASANPAPEQTLAAYRGMMLERYDRQIRLARSAKYWYILPFWMGLMLSAVELLWRTGDTVRFAILVVFVTVINAALWWANDVAAVRYLRRQRSQLSEVFGSEGGSK